MPKAALLTDLSKGRERIGLQLDSEQLARLDAVCKMRYGGNRALGARAALLVGLAVLEDRRTYGLEPAEALAAYLSN